MRESVCVYIMHDSVAIVVVVAGLFSSPGDKGDDDDHKGVGFHRDLFLFLEWMLSLQNVGRCIYILPEVWKGMQSKGTRSQQTNLLTKRSRRLYSVIKSHAKGVYIVPCCTRANRERERETVEQDRNLTNARSP